MTTTVVGLTGSIGTGKSTVALMLKRLHIPVQEADSLVHHLFKHDRNIRDQIAAQFPGAVRDDSVDRSVLGQIVFNDRDKLTELEHILHPKVRQLHLDFIKDHRQKGTPLIVLDIPLLFEINWQIYCDKIAVTHCQQHIQFERVLKRRNMNIAYLQNIIAKQWPADVKRARADYIIDTNQRKINTFHQVRAILTHCH